MKFAALAISLLLGACVSTPREPITVSSIRLADDRDVVEWTLSSDGDAIHNASGRRYQFTAPADLTSGIIANARALSARGSFDCPDAPSYMPDRFIVIQENGVTRRTQYQYGCGDAERQRRVDALLRADDDLRSQAIMIANSAPLDATSINVRFLSWGHADTWWTVTRDGEGAYFADGVERRFQVTAGTYDSIYAVMRPWQGSGVSCADAPTDGPYGAIIFAVGEETRRSAWRLGCSSENSEDLYRRLSEATDTVRALAHAQTPAP